MFKCTICLYLLNELISQCNLYPSYPKQWFSAKGDFSSLFPGEQETGGKLFLIKGWGCWMSLASIGQGLGTLINILQCTGQHCTTKTTYPDQNGNIAVTRLRNPALEPSLMLLMKQFFCTFHPFLKKKPQTKKHHSFQTGLPLSYL